MNLRRLFLYDDWANHEEVAHLRTIVSPPPPAVRILAHIAATQWLWLDRLHGRDASVPVWPEWDIAECARQFEALKPLWPAEIEAPDRDAVEYINSKGERFTSRSGDILMHVLFHGAYHRGQIATLLRAGRQTPPYTDYIHCTRQGLIGVD